MSSVDSFGSKGTLEVGDASYEIYRLSAVPGVEKLPFSLKVLAENLLRTEDGANITADHVNALATWDPDAQPDTEIQFTPARVIMQDFTGVPCVVDLATMREAVVDLGGDATRINPLAPAELVIDHSVQIDVAGRADAFERNVALEYERNRERYQFLRWGQTAFDDFKVVPPGTGIVHQVNIEYLARGVMVRDGKAYPDTCVGTDSHTTMVNGLGVLGWGVGGIEAEAAMLGQPVSMLIPRVVGFKLTGTIPSGVTATDIVLTITQKLRQHGVVGKFVEFYGEGVASVPLANRATIGNMSPEFGSTAAMFPIDRVTLDYLRLTGRSEEQLALVEAYAKEQGMWLDPTLDSYVEPVFSEYLELDLSTVVPSIAGPKRPQDRIELSRAKEQFQRDLPTLRARGRQRCRRGRGGVVPGVRLARDHLVGDARLPDRRHRGPVVRPVPRRRRDRVDHELHQHVEPVGHDRRGPRREEGRREGPHRQAVGQDVDGARLAGRHQLLREGRPVAVPREAGLPPGRLRLRHLHRQLGPARREGVGDRAGARPGRRRGALGQPQLRGSHQPRHQDELPGLPAAGHRVRAGRDDGLRLRVRPAGSRRGRSADLPARHLAVPGGGPDDDRRVDRPRDVHQGLRRRVHRRRPVALAADARGRHVRVGPAVDLRAQAPVLRGHAGDAVAGRRLPRRARAGQAGRLGDHRPHQPGRLHQGRQPGGPLPGRARRRASRLQQLRLAPRQPRGHDPRHVRQHPAAQPAGPGRRGRVHARTC